MGNITTTVRIPSKLKEAADNLIEKGYYKNFSDIMVSGLRYELNEGHIPLCVKESREGKKAVWSEYLKKGNGDPQKAIKIMQAEDDEAYAKNPDFWQL